jgi:hypothetical protein
MTLGAGIKLGSIVLAAGLACGCANSGFDLSTGSVAADKSATALKTDPVCVSLANQINTIKGDGTIERLEKAAAGKSAKVQVKREALQKQAELNKANADFQTRCGPTIPKQVATQATPAASAASVQAANVAAASKPKAD